MVELCVDFTHGHCSADTCTFIRAVTHLPRLCTHHSTAEGPSCIANGKAYSTYARLSLFALISVPSGRTPIIKWPDQRNWVDNEFHPFVLSL